SYTLEEIAVYRDAAGRAVELGYDADGPPFGGARHLVEEPFLPAPVVVSRYNFVGEQGIGRDRAALPARAARIDPCDLLRIGRLHECEHARRRAASREKSAVGLDQGARVGSADDASVAQAELQTVVSSGIVARRDIA